MALIASILVSAAAGAGIRLQVPVVAQAPERCGPAALSMVLRWYGADSTASRIGDCGFDPILRGALITDLARCARAAGFDAVIERPGEDSLRALMARGIPPVLLYARGIGPVARFHYGVLVGWEPDHDRFVLNDGRRKPTRMGREALMRRWGAAGGQVLVVRRSRP